MVCLFVCVLLLMVLDYNKLLVKRSNIVVYSSLQSPRLHAHLHLAQNSVCVCLYVSLLHSYTSAMLESNFPP